MGAMPGVRGGFFVDGRFSSLTKLVSDAPCWIGEGA